MGKNMHQLITKQSNILELRIQPAVGAVIDVTVKGSDTVGSLKQWLHRRNYYASLTLACGSQSLCYDFLTWDEYGVRSGMILHCTGIPVGARSTDVATVSGQLDRKSLREIKDLKAVREKEPHRHFGQEYVRYTAHDFRDTYGGGNVLTVQNRMEEEPWGCRMRSELDLSPQQQMEVRQLRDAAKVRQMRAREDAREMSNAYDRVALEGRHQHHDSRRIMHLPSRTT